jgi:hypothetical protein
MTDSTTALLAEREKTHGDFAIHAQVTCAIKDVMTNYNNWGDLHVTQREALDMIAHKIGRILAGDPDFKDHWDDIAGYAKLIANRLS